MSRGHWGTKIRYNDLNFRSEAGPEGINWRISRHVAIKTTGMSEILGECLTIGENGCQSSQDGLGGKYLKFGVAEGREHQP